jgi:tryptophan-rich sensory protein
MKLNYIIIPAITIIVGALGRYYTSLGMDWYQTINLPSYTPPNWVFGVVWNAIFLLATIAALVVWNTFDNQTHRFKIMIIFAINAVLNIAWSYLFFTNHLIGLALIESLALNATIISLTVLIAQKSVATALLLTPYLGWVSFATLLTAHIWFIN